VLRQHRSTRAVDTSTGDTITVGADETLLAVLQRARVHAPYDGMMLACVSRAARGEHLKMGL
jgi:hypothetical protein